MSIDAPPLLDSDNVFTGDPVQPFFDDAGTSEYLCEVCGKALVYSGRGRHPRFCDDHKPNQRKSVGTSSRTPGVEALKRQFHSQWDMIAEGVSHFNEIDGFILWKGGEGLTDALGNAMEVDPKFRKAMAKAMQATVYGQIAAAVMPMALMLAMNHGLMKPSKQMQAKMSTMAQPEDT